MLKSKFITNQKPNFQPIKRTFQKAGKWVEKPTETKVLVCVCGMKYIKTRKQQDACIKCFTQA